MLKDNWTPSSSDYETLHKQIGHRFKVSHRIIGVVKSYFAQTFPDTSEPDDVLVKEAVTMRRHFEKQLVRMNECLRPKKIAYAQLVLKDETSLDKLFHRIATLKSDLDDLTGSIERVTLRLNLIRYIKFLEQHPDVLREILQTNLPEKEAPSESEKSL